MPFFQEISDVCGSEPVPTDNAVLISAAFIAPNSRSAVSLVNLQAGDYQLLQKVSTNTNIHIPGVYALKLTGKTLFLFIIYYM